MKNEFETIIAPTEGLYKEKGSKFLAYAYPVSSEEEVNECVQALKKQYYDARHHCYAYVIGLKDQRFRANDDGEPNHSAGDPILGQIRSKGLTNVLVVVVRYFGGIKLGVGGLIYAYKTAADEALSLAQTKKIYSKTRFELRFTYEETSIVERKLANYDISYMDKQYAADVCYIGEVVDEVVAALSEEFDLLEAQITIEED